MLTGPPLVDPKVEMLPKLCKEEIVNWNQPSLWEVIGYHYEVDRYVCWNKSNTMFVSLILIAAG